MPRVFDAETPRRPVLDDPQGLGDVAALPVQSVDGSPVRIALSFQEAVDLARRDAGEDEDTGLAPVTEEVFDEETGIPDDHDEDENPVIAYTLWSESERERQLSRLPVEALHEILKFRFRNEPGPWWRQEHEVILEALARAHFILDAGGLGKVMALHAILTAPMNHNPFYEDPESFRFLCVCLSGRPVNADDFVLPTPLEMAVALTVIREIRFNQLEPEVCGFIAATCFEQGLWALPPQLSDARDAMLTLCWNMDIDVTKETVAECLALADSEEADASAIPDVVTTDVQIQALRLLSTRRRIEAALRRGDEIRDRFLAALYPEAEAAATTESGT